MKHISTLVNAILAAIMIVMLLSLGLPGFHAQAATQAPDQDQELSCSTDRSIHVSGTAVLNVAPDRALIQLGVQSNGKTPGEVQAKNAAAINNVIKALKGLGVEAKDISTDHYMIEPIYENYDALHIKGYRTHNLIAITMRDVDQTSEAIATAFQAGANQVVNVEFYTSELRKYRDQAREMATTAAREKADALSQAAGAETGCVLNLSENSWSYFGGQNWWYGGNNQNLWTQNVAHNVAPTAAGTPGGDDTPVSAGQISIRAEVSLTLALE
jgi:hypothetical protein